MASAGWAQEISPGQGLSGQGVPMPGPAAPGTGDTAGHPAILDLIGLGLAMLAPVSLALLWWRGVIGAGALSRPQVRKLGVQPWWVWAIAPVAIYFAMGLGGAVAMAMVEGRHELTRTAALMLAGGGAGIAAAMGFRQVVLVPPAARRAGANPGGCAACGYDLSGLAPGAACPECGGTLRHGPPPAIELEGVELAPRWRDVRQGLLGLAAAFPIVQAASVAAAIAWTLVMGAPPRELAHDTLRLIKDHFHEPAVWGIVFGAVVLAPIAEELTFRVFVQSAVLRATGRPWLAVLVASLIFALVHLGGGVAPEDAHALAPLFVFGLALGTAYEKTRRVWVPIVMHMAFNALNVGLTGVA